MKKYLWNVNCPKCDYHETVPLREVERAVMSCKYHLFDTDHIVHLDMIEIEEED